MDLVRIERGQLVLVAAAVIAIALMSILFAYLQLGYHPDIDSAPDPADEDAIALLDRSVHSAAMESAGEYDWDERAALVAAVRSEIDKDIETLETTRINEGVGYRARYNESAAADWNGAVCSSSPGKRFSDCRSDGGVIVQERAGEAVLVAVAFDIRVVTPEMTADLTVVVEMGG